LQLGRRGCGWRQGKVQCLLRPCNSRAAALLRCQILLGAIILKWGLCSVNEVVNREEKLPLAKEAAPEIGQMPEVPRKRVFIGLLAVTCLIIAGLAYFLWWIPYVGLRNIHPYLPGILAVLLSLAVLAVLVGSLLLTATILTERDFLLSRKLRGAVVKVLFPLLIVMGKVFGISRERIPGRCTRWAACVRIFTTTMPIATASRRSRRSPRPPRRSRWPSQSSSSGTASSSARWR